MADGYDELPRVRSAASAARAADPMAALARSGRRAAGDRQTALRVEVLDRKSALRRLPAELDDLAARALEANIFAEAPVFTAALEHIDPDTPLRIACVRDEVGMLLGVFPLALAPLRRGVRIMVLRNWTHRYCFLGTPLVDADRARAVLTALGRWIESGAAPAGGLHWTKLSWDGPFGALVRETFADPPWRMDVTTEQRALLVREPDMRAAISTKHAKELRRLERRLSESGALTYAAIRPGEDWGPWFDDFLAVEASGWKGAEGSAIRSRPQDAAFFRSVVRQAHERGQLQLLRLDVAGRAVAMKLNLRARDRAYALKIGYDETFARFSPGVLLELFNIRTLDQEPEGIRSMDSCAAEKHPMINRLWSGRREIASVMLVRRGVLLRAAGGLLPVGRRLRKAVKSRLRPRGRTP
jgi:CelD/BcsL family acetyltransferase involved in cellulose biosynthesis